MKLCVASGAKMYRFATTPSQEDTPSTPQRRTRGTVNNGTRWQGKMRVTARIIWEPWLCPKYEPSFQPYGLYFHSPRYESPGLKGILSYWDMLDRTRGDFLPAILLLFQTALLIDLVITWLTTTLDLNHSVLASLLDIYIFLVFVSCYKCK